MAEKSRSVFQAQFPKQGHLSKVHKVVNIICSENLHTNSGAGYSLTYLFIAFDSPYLANPSRYNSLHQMIYTIYKDVQDVF